MRKTHTNMGGKKKKKRDEQGGVDIEIGGRGREGAVGLNRERRGVDL